MAPFTDITDYFFQVMFTAQPHGLFRFLNIPIWIISLYIIIRYRKIYDFIILGFVFSFVFIAIMPWWNSLINIRFIAIVPLLSTWLFLTLYYKYKSFILAKKAYPATVFVIISVIAIYNILNPIGGIAKDTVDTVGDGAINKIAYFTIYDGANQIKKTLNSNDGMVIVIGRGSYLELRGGGNNLVWSNKFNCEYIYDLDNMNEKQKKKFETLNNNSFVIYIKDNSPIPKVLGAKLAEKGISLNDFEKIHLKIGKETHEILRFVPTQGERR